MLGTIKGKRKVLRCWESGLSPKLDSVNVFSQFNQAFESKEVEYIDCKIDSKIDLDGSFYQTAVVFYYEYV